MEQLKVVQGAANLWPLQCWNRGKLSTATFGVGDTLSAYLYQGQNQVLLDNLSAIWFTGEPPGSQVGYTQGQVQIGITSAQSGPLDANGDYTIVLWWTAAAGGDSRAVGRAALVVEPAAGTGTRGIQPYCQLSDMLMYAPWIRKIQSQDTDQEGFYSQRIEARKWLDFQIVKYWRGGTWGVFGDASRPASEWSGWGTWRTPLPSPYLLNLLSGGFIQTPGAVTITAPGTGYTSPPVISVPAPTGRPSGGGPAQTAAFSCALNGTGGIGSITVNVQGMGYTAGSVLTLTFTGGGGAGAMATAQVSAGALIVRDQIVRLSAYKAISLLGAAQLMTNNQFAAYGQYFEDKVSEQFQQTVAELDVNGDGYADMAIPLGRSNTIYE